MDGKFLLAGGVNAVVCEYEGGVLTISGGIWMIFLGLVLVRCLRGSLQEVLIVDCAVVDAGSVDPNDQKFHCQLCLTFLMTYLMVGSPSTDRDRTFLLWLWFSMGIPVWHHRWDGCCKKILPGPWEILGMSCCWRELAVNGRGRYWLSHALWWTGTRYSQPIASLTYNYLYPPQRC